MATATAQRRAARIRIDPRRKFGLEIEAVAPVYRQRVAELLTRAGIDAEAESYNHYTVDYWKVITDASVVAPYDKGGYPMEIVSPPMRGKEGLRQLKKVTDVLEDIGASVNNSCGLHVHHDVHDLEAEHIKDVARYYVLHEGIMDEFMTPYRRGRKNDYCHSLRSMWGGSVHDAFRHIRDMGEDFNGISYDWGTRQAKLNGQVLCSRGTLEFRHHDASIEYAEIAYWLAFTQTIVNAARQGQLHVGPRMKPNMERMFKLAKVQPIVRWHFLEQEERYRYDELTRWVDERTYEVDKYEDEDEEEYEEPCWDDDPDPFLDTTEENSFGDFYFPDCLCQACIAARERTE